MNTVINIFQEQFNLIDNLPENEREKVLYLLIQSKFNQVDCFEIQSRLSLSLSLSNLSLSVIDIISKTMRIKIINENHGGLRKGAGAPKGNNNADRKQSNQSKNNQDSIKLIVSEKETPKINVPEYLLRSDSYDELSSIERYFYDNPELRPLLTQYWQGKTELYNEIGEIYIRLLTDKMKIQPKQINFDKILNNWNLIAGKYNLSKCQTLTAGRKSAICARLKEHKLTEQQFIDTCDIALSKSAFLRGEKSSWKANIDFFLQASSFIKVIEGQYNGSIMQDLSAKDKLKIAEDQKKINGLADLIEKSKRGEI